MMSGWKSVCTFNLLSFESCQLKIRARHMRLYSWLRCKQTNRWLKSERVSKTRKSYLKLNGWQICLADCDDNFEKDTKMRYTNKSNWIFSIFFFLSAMKCIRVKDLINICQYAQNPKGRNEWRKSTSKLTQSTVRSTKTPKKRWFESMNTTAFAVDMSKF